MSNPIHVNKTLSNQYSPLHSSDPIDTTRYRYACTITFVAGVLLEKSVGITKIAKRLFFLTAVTWLFHTMFVLYDFRGAKLRNWNQGKNLSAGERRSLKLLDHIHSDKVCSLNSMENNQDNQPYTTEANGYRYTTRDAQATFLTPKNLKEMIKYHPEMFQNPKTKEDISQLYIRCAYCFGSIYDPFCVKLFLQRTIQLPLVVRKKIAKSNLISTITTMFEQMIQALPTGLSNRQQNSFLMKNSRINVLNDDRLTTQPLDDNSESGYESGSYCDSETEETTNQFSYGVTMNTAGSSLQVHND